MPVDRQTFEAVRQRVIETAPAGLSREQFDALLDQEVAKMETAQPTVQPQVAGMSDAQWAALPPAEKARNVLRWGGNVIAGMTGMGSAGREAVEHPAATLATAAVPLAAKAAAPLAKAAKPFVWPTRAAAGQKFQQVMGAAKNAPVDTSGAEQVATRIWDLAGGMGKVGRGGSMPKPVSDFIKRMTDPNQGPLLYQEARDFASNIGRLSVKESTSLNPVMHAEIHKLRLALNAAVGKTAASVGKGPEYLSAMKEYARAARRAELGRAVAKKGLQAAGLTGGAYLAGKALGVDVP